MVASLCTAYGLNVLTDLSIGVAAPPGATVDLEMLLGDTANDTDTVPEGIHLAGGPPDDDFMTILVADAQGYRLRVRSLADVRISPDVRKLICSPAPGCGEAHIRELSATILSFVLPLRGTAALHSACFAGVPGLSVDGAVALLGAGGAGKSTLAGHFVAAGARFVSDDLLPVRLEKGSPVVTGGSSELRVRETATDLLGVLGNRAARRTVDGRIAFRLDGVHQFPIPIGLAILPEVSSSGAPTAQRIAPAGAFVSLLGMSRSQGWTSARFHQIYFDVCAAIAHTLPVVKLTWVPGAVSAREMVKLVQRAVS